MINVSIDYFNTITNTKKSYTISLDKKKDIIKEIDDDIYKTIDRPVFLVWGKIIEDKEIIIDESNSIDTNDYDDFYCINIDSARDYNSYILPDAYVGINYYEE